MIDINNYKATTARGSEFIAESNGRPIRGTALMQLEATMANVYGSCTNAQPGRSKSPTQNADELRAFFLGKAAADADAAIAILSELLDEMRDVKAVIAAEV
jgi:hypothetical protein